MLFVNLMVLNKFLLCYMGLRTIFPEMTLQTRNIPISFYKLSGVVQIILISKVTTDPRTSGNIGVICVGHQYQRFGMSFGVKPIHF